jgi:hypothetical protein
VRARATTMRATLAAATMATAMTWTPAAAGRTYWRGQRRAARVARAVRASRVAKARSRTMNDHEEEIVPQIVP